MISVRNYLQNRDPGDLHIQFNIRLKPSEQRKQPEGIGKIGAPCKSRRSRASPHCRNLQISTTNKRNQRLSYSCRQTMRKSEQNATGCSQPSLTTSSLLLFLLHRLIEIEPDCGLIIFQRY